MTAAKPVRVYRGGFGIWFAAKRWRETSPGVFLAEDRLDVENQDELNSLAEDAGRWQELQRLTGKSEDEIFAAFGLVPIENGTADSET